ncbi:helix-turn-helix transcriptional regulator [Duganella sp. LX20W]|uniref:Helix-turn-helix transcriptional regulator n=1 Tax=Rugamonas brunnea TaxID=2758569 RepID=A0A7W2EVR9_9BURK|nr:helix-turn-helix transcriptional regulator [Rugamonas brunnea]MBA5639475.1 helix-turn-helix transcriptional regulator [Rugamonas brunnea]
MAFGVVLRSFRKKAGLSQEQLALEAGVERNFVSLIERGINQPTIRIIFKLAAALQVDPSAMMKAVEQHLAQESLPTKPS